MTISNEVKTWTGIAAVLVGMGVTYGNLKADLNHAITEGEKREQLLENHADLIQRLVIAEEQRKALDRAELQQNAAILRLLEDIKRAQ